MITFASKSHLAVSLILAAATAHGQVLGANGPTAMPLRLNPTSGGALGPYAPPACVPGVPFADITCTTGFDPWIEQFGLDGITAGCGGGNYCPGTPVTRDQMAVFIEKAMRGTGNWPPHTQFVWAVKASDGSADPVASGTGLLNAVAAIPTSGNDVPSVVNPWLLKIGPGIYDLGVSIVSLPAYVSVEGSGVNATVVQATNSSPFVFSCAGNGELASLSANSTGTGSQAVGIELDGPMRLTHVNVQVQGASTINAAVVAIFTGPATFTDVELTATGGTYARDLENQAASTIMIRGGTFAASGGSGSNLYIYNYLNSGTISVAGSQLASGSVSGTVTCAGVYDGVFGFYASTCP